VELPGVARAVVADGRRAEFSGDEGRDERPAALILSCDQSYGESGAAAFAVHVEPERPDRPAARAGLVRIEEAEEHPRPPGRLRECERARGAELVVEGPGADLVGVERGLGRPRDRPTHFARRLPGKIRL